MGDVGWEIVNSEWGMGNSKDEGETLTLGEAIDSLVRHGGNKPPIYKSPKLAKILLLTYVLRTRNTYSCATLRLSLTAEPAATAEQEGCANVVRRVQSGTQ